MRVSNLHKPRLSGHLPRIRGYMSLFVFELVYWVITKDAFPVLFRFSFSPSQLLPHLPTLLPSHRPPLLHATVLLSLLC